jgi:hypothetical protein
LISAAGRAYKKKTNLSVKMCLTKHNLKTSKGGLLMRNSIQLILTDTFERIMRYYETNGLREIHIMTKEFKAIGDDMMLEILRVFIENADRALCDEAKEERKANGLTIKERDVERRVHTSLGSLTYERTHFKRKGSGYVHILDHILGVGAYERVDAGVSADMVNTSSVHSYGASAAIVTSGQISRQTAWKKMQEVGEVAYVPERSGHTPEVLHIFADEDHVNLQDGKNTQVPLVTYCAGKEVVSKGRNALIDPIHVQGYGLTPEKHWSYVYSLMTEQYDMKKVAQIFIYGDGARWIKTGLDMFPDAIHVLDEYHLEKRIKSFLSGEICKVFAPRVRAAVNSGNASDFQALFYKMEDALLSGMEPGKGMAKRLKALRADGAFLLAHWQAILNGRHPLSIGSCTEAQVSHVLSKRLSRDPMGWSPLGLAKLSMVRVFCLNGGVVMPCDIGADKNTERTVIKNIKAYEDIVMKQHDEIFKGWRDWRWFDKDDDNLISRKTTGTRVAVYDLMKMRDIS